MLITKYKAKIREEENASGISCEESELDQPLEEIIDKEKLADEKCSEANIIYCIVDENGFYPEMKCQGQPYRSAHPLTCEFHALAYEIECAERAKKADEVIHPDMGKGHSNLPEATFSVLTKFRAKDTNLHQKHYEASTNLGLLQANMTWCFKVKGSQYHWIVELYSRMGLPILSGIQEMVCL